MKKMKRGVVLLLSALLVWTPAGAVRADATTGAADVNAQIKIQENKVPEDAAQTNEAQAIHQQAAEGGEVRRCQRLCLERRMWFKIIKWSRAVEPGGIMILPPIHCISQRM